MNLEKQKQKIKTILTQNRYLLYEAIFFFVTMFTLTFYYLQLPVTFESNNQDLSPKSTIYLKFKRPASKEIYPKIEPNVPGEWIIHKTPFWIKGVEFIPKSHLPPGKQYSVMLDGIKPVINLRGDNDTTEFQITTKKPSSVALLLPKDGEANVKTDSKIVLKLDKPNQDLRKLRAESSWALKNDYPKSQDDTTFEWEFIKPLVREKEVTFSVFDEYQAVDKLGLLAKHTFTTVPGEVTVTKLSPNNVTASLGALIEIAFNQEVSKTSAEKAFFINPFVAGNFSWEGNVLRYSTSSKSYDTRYSFGVNPGIEAIYGLASTSKFESSFKTDYRTQKLAVPSYRQAYSLSCEESALRMALAYRGVYASDWDILQRVGYNPKPRDIANNKWDDPDLMYVGDVDGRMGVTGWGVYSGPIANAARSYGRDADPVIGVTSSQIAQSIYNNNPVILWGIIGNAVQADSWSTEEGKVVSAPLNAHVRLVYGVKGEADNPVGFYLHDPIYGSLYWTRTQLEWNMSFAGSQTSQAVVVK